jgi:hypothetical protein
MDAELRMVIECLKLLCYSFEENETTNGIAYLPGDGQAILIRWILHS